MANGTETTTPETVPPVEAPEYYPGFGQEFEQAGVGLQSAYERMQKAEAELNQPALVQVMPEGFWKTLAGEIGRAHV